MINGESAIFVDTNAYESIGFNFDERNKLISQFKEILLTKKYINISVSLIDMEIQKHINIKIQETKQKIKKYCKWIYDLVDYSKIEQKLNKNLYDYDIFKRATNTIELNLEGINPEIVMEKYFNLQAPFELSKQYEFKDAFFLQAIYKFAECHSDYLSFIVITDDNGIKKAIEEQRNKKIIYFNSISDFIDSIIEYNNESKKNLFDYISTYNFNKQIEEKIKINVTDVEEEIIDIDSCECQGIYFPKIIKKTDEKVTIICNMNIVLTGIFQCLDYNKSYYLKEDNEYIYKEYKTKEYLNFICQTVIEVNVAADKFSDAIIIDLPDIEISYKTFMTAEDYLEGKMDF